MNELNLSRKLRKPFSWTDNDLYEVQCPDRFRPYMLAVYGFLARRADRNSECYPSQQDVYFHTGVSIRQIVRVIGFLIERRMVYRIKRGRMRSNRYRLLDRSVWILKDREVPVVHFIGASPAYSEVPGGHTKKIDTNKKKELILERKALAQRKRLP